MPIVCGTEIVPTVGTGITVEGRSAVHALVELQEQFMKLESKEQVGVPLKFCPVKLIVSVGVKVTLSADQPLAVSCTEDGTIAMGVGGGNVAPEMFSVKHTTHGAGIPVGTAPTVP